MVIIAALVIAVLGLLAGAAGLGLYLAQRHDLHKRKAQRQLPRRWPLSPRPLTNSTERQMWHWLQHVFPDHHIMIKLPITRFTAPLKPGEANDWFAPLNSAYCTFTLCDARGTVIGCVDVVGPQGMAQSTRQLKLTLLTQCGIGYRAVAPQALPPVSALRADFLGDSRHHHNDADSDAEPSLEQRQHTAPETIFEEATLQLHETLERNRRRHRQSEYVPLGANDAIFVPSSSQPQSYQYQPQPDSFLASLDSRRALLGNS